MNEEEVIEQIEYIDIKAVVLRIEGITEKSKWFSEPLGEWVDGIIVKEENFARYKQIRLWLDQ
jgi:hypothetical protein